jgi:hypothetical protein
MKIIGRAEEMDPEAIAVLVYRHLHDRELPETWAAELDFASRPKGAWMSYTFWIVLPHELAEKPLREAIQALPGVVMQL